MQASFHPYKTVSIVGAGCGDPELLTLKAARLISEADVVITDRLVSRDILQMHVREDALIVYAGKQCRKGHSTPQETINQLMVRYALEDKKVVRLKGGDVSIFSNILDELQALKTHHISYEIVPGISAALGAAAYAGIPLTARGYATAVRLLTCYKPELLPTAYWEELAKTADTLVFYMSGDTALSLVQHLLKHQVPSGQGIAIIEQATTPMQRVSIYAIHDFEESAGNRSFLSPTLIIIGKVTQLHETYAWLPDYKEKELYFPPVGASHALTQTIENVSSF